MSRAFVSEGDGWMFCQSHRQSCMYADEYGRCIFRECRLDEEKQVRDAGPAGRAGQQSDDD